MTYAFGPFALDTETRQLLAHGRELHVSPKAFDLLLLLLRHRSRAVAKTELQDTLWPSTFVGETNLATLVAEIRRALGDSAQAPAYLRTVHRFGYRFVADVAEGPAAITPAANRVHVYLATADRQFTLKEGIALIGRADDADVQIDAGGVSRHHARLTIRGTDVRVEDLSSKNGTFVDGTPIVGAHTLADGSEIRVGPVTLTFRIATGADPTETMV